MSGTLNKVILIGRVGKDPEIRATQSGGTIANMSLATEEKWRDKQSGEQRKRTEWHRVVCFNDQLSEIIKKYVRKGALVYIEGQLTTRKWTDQQGVERYTTEVAMPRFGGVLKMLGGGEQQQQGGQQQNRPAGRQPDLDDDIPF